MPRWRRPLLPKAGRPVIAGLCGYELIALAVNDPHLPPITSICRMRYGRALAAALLITLGHHLLLESDDIDQLARLIGASAD